MIKQEKYICVNRIIYKFKIEIKNAKVIKNVQWKYWQRFHFVGWKVFL